MKVKSKHIHNEKGVLEYWNRDDVESMYDKNLLKLEIQLIKQRLTKNSKILDAGCGEGEGSNVWDDFDYVNFKTGFRDMVAAYPTMNSPIDTIQWEGFREAIDDIRYLTTLNKSIDVAKKLGKNTSEAENWLASLKSSNLKTQNLDTVRATMVKYILDLQGYENQNDGT